MRLALIGLGVLVAAIVLVWVIGMLLPKGHVATRSAGFKVPRERVWELLTDFAGQPAWRKSLKSVERASDQNGHEVWVDVNSRGERMPYETLDAAAPAKLVRKIADPSLPFGGTWTWELIEEDGGTRLRITERGEVYNPLFRVVSQFMDMRKTIDGFLIDLGTKLGEPVKLED